ncbi:MAG: phosphorylase [Clostridium beijerinckii]|nr:phosphorylase [Clostridium beijerinckii]
MITNTFDDKTEAIIIPENFYEKKEKVCETCIVTFSNVVVENILQTFRCEKIDDIMSANGLIPIYKLNYKGKEIAFYMTMISSTGAGTCIEEARCLIGAKKYIMFGSCGCLDKEITAGKVIIPTEAYRDEGFSYHYVPAEDYITIRNADVIAKAFKDMGIPYVKGKTWTTDGIYRETKANMEKRKKEGCIAVEMECAGVQAVCDFRGLEYYDFLISGDLLDSQEWDRRILGNDEERTHQLKNFYIALELALRV